MPPSCDFSQYYRAHEQLLRGHVLRQMQGSVEWVIQFPGPRQLLLLRATPTRLIEGIDRASRVCLGSKITIQSREKRIGCSLVRTDVAVQLCVQADLSGAMLPAPEIDVAIAGGGPGGLAAAAAIIRALPGSRVKARDLQGCAGHCLSRNNLAWSADIPHPSCRCMSQLQATHLRELECSSI